MMRFFYQMLQNADEYICRTFEIELNVCMEASQMLFRTLVSPAVPPFHVTHEAPILLLGSCFAQEMGQRLQSQRFDVNVNPFGILYHPIAMLQLLSASVEGETFSIAEVVKKQSAYVHLRAHSHLQSDTEQGVVTQLAHALGNTNDYLAKAQVLVLTFGTALAHHWQNESGFVVANCHKQPANQFVQRRWSSQELFDAYKPVLDRLFEKYPGLRVVISVSPVRYLREGAVGNSRSKAALIAFCDLLSTHYPEQIYYFPAYEMLLDELRDYRWFAEDMLHPSAQAIDYIAQRFNESCFSPDTIQLLNELKHLQKGLSHRPFQAESAQHQQFLRHLMASFIQFEQKYPHLHFENEMAQIQAQLN